MTTNCPSSDRPDTFPQVRTTRPSFTSCKFAAQTCSFSFSSIRVPPFPVQTALLSTPWPPERATARPARSHRATFRSYKAPCSRAARGGRTLFVIHVVARQLNHADAEPGRKRERLLHNVVRPRALFRVGASEGEPSVRAQAHRLKPDAKLRAEPAKPLRLRSARSGAGF